MVYNTFLLLCDIAEKQLETVSHCSNDLIWIMTLELLNSWNWRILHCYVYMKLLWNDLLDKINVAWQFQELLGWNSVHGNTVFCELFILPKWFPIITAGKQDTKTDAAPKKDAYIWIASRIL